MQNQKSLLCVLCLKSNLYNIKVNIKCQMLWAKSTIFEKCGKNKFFDAFCLCFTLFEDFPYVLIFFILWHWCHCFYSVTFSLFPSSENNSWKFWWQQPKIMIYIDSLFVSENSVITWDCSKMDVFTLQSWHSLPIVWKSLEKLPTNG